MTGMTDVMNALILMQGGPGDAIKTALDAIAPELRILGVSLMTIGFLVWGLAKLAAPIAPEMAASTQGYITKAFIGMLVLGLASTLASWIGNLIP
jgi:hypothetical protein